MTTTRASYANTVTTHDGLPVQIVPNATITLYEAGTTDPLSDTIYAGPTGAATLPNPFFADSHGSFHFYLASGKDIKVTATGVGVGTLTLDYERVMPSVEGLVYNGMTGPIVFGDGATISVGAPITPTHNVMRIIEENNYAAHQTFDVIYDHSGTVADVGTSRFMMRQLTGGVNVNIRAIEAHTLKMSGDLASAAIGIDCSINSTIPGNGINGSVGVWIRNLGSIWGLTAPKIADTGLLIGDDNQGFTNPIWCRDTAANSSATLFRLGTAGQITARHTVPLANNTYNLGDASTYWQTGYILKLFAGAGSAAIPGITFGGLTDIGLFVPAANTLGFAGGGAETGRISAGGIQAVGSFIARQMTNPTTPAAGYTSLSPDAGDGWWLRKSSGTKVKVLDADDVQTTESAFSGTQTTATPATVAGGSLTLTTKGGDLLVWAAGNAQNTNAGIPQTVGLRLDTGAEVSVFRVDSFAGLAGYAVPFALVHRFSGVGAASHTVTVRHTNVAATGTMTTVGTLLVLELPA